MTQLAIPLVGVLTLHAGPAQMGVLTAVDRAPYLVFGLVAGVWVDRRRRRPVMVWAAAAEAVLLLSIPVAALWGALSMVQLWAVGFLAGSANLLFEVAGMALVPAIVGRELLVGANSRIQATDAAAATLGPPLAGALIQAVTAPVAIVVDGAATAIKVALLTSVPPDTTPARTAGASWTSELREGLELVLGSPILRSIAGCTATSNLFGSSVGALYILFAVSSLHLSPAQLGLVLATAGPASLVAALAAGTLARRIGLGWAMVVGTAGFACPPLLVPWLPAGAWFTIPVLMLGSALGPAGGVIYNINQVSLRQAITPDRLLGRMSATMRFLVWGVIPLGALGGGLLAQAVGLRPALWVCAAGVPFSLAWLLAGGIPKLRRAPAGEAAVGA